MLVIKGEGKKPTTNTLERYLNNDYPADDAIKAQDLAIFRSGKLKGTGHVDHRLVRMTQRASRT